MQNNEEEKELYISFNMYILSDRLDVNHRIAFDIRTSDGKHHIVVMDICK